MVFETIVKENSIVIGVLALFTLITFAKKIIRLCSNTAKTLLPGYDLIKRYGADSYAVISACTDGIGKGFAIELAKIGFNLVMLVRDTQKAQKVQKEIQELVKRDFKCKIIQIDFNDSLKEGEIERVCSQIKDLDISLLINNVGKSIETKCFEQISEEHLLQIVNMNVGAQLLLSNKLMPKLSGRHLKSGIINISSLSALFPIAGFAPYCATKKFNDYLSRCLSEEYRDKVDILSLRPGFVRTPMTEKFLEGQKNIITPEQCAQAALRDLGKFDKSEGHYEHVIARTFYRLLRSKINQYMIKESINLRKKNN